MNQNEIKNLISQMTLEEKAGMCSGADFWHLKGKLTELQREILFRTVNGCI